MIFTYVILCFGFISSEVSQLTDDIIKNNVNSDDEKRETDHKPKSLLIGIKIRLTKGIEIHFEVVIS